MNLYGHTHSDYFKAVTSISEPHNPIAALTICGSITTWISASPSFCIYEVDAETMLPVTRTTYAFNMTKANIERSIDWV